MSLLIALTLKNGFGSRWLLVLLRSGIIAWPILFIDVTPANRTFRISLDNVFSLFSFNTKWTCIKLLNWWEENLVHVQIERVPMLCCCETFFHFFALIILWRIVVDAVKRILPQASTVYKDVFNVVETIILFIFERKKLLLLCIVLSKQCLCDRSRERSLTRNQPIIICVYPPFLFSLLRTRFSLMAQTHTKSRLMAKFCISFVHSTSDKLKSMTT